MANGTVDDSAHGGKLGPQGASQWQRQKQLSRTAPDGHLIVGLLTLISIFRNSKGTGKRNVSNTCRGRESCNERHVRSWQ